jgi:hypothetical protein
MQQRLKSAPAAAWAEIVAPEFFDELDVAVHHAHAALDLSFGRERLPPLTRDAESRGGRRDRDACAWPPPSEKSGPYGRAGFYHPAQISGKPDGSTWAACLCM